MTSLLRRLGGRFGFWLRFGFGFGFRRGLFRRRGFGDFGGRGGGFGRTQHEPESISLQEI